MNHKKILAVFYSRSGVTKKVMEHLAQQLKCDVEELIDPKDRSGFWGFIKSGRDAIKMNLAEIKPIKYDPQNYDLVIIGTPIWASNMASAVRTYLTQNKDKLKDVALVSTMGGGGYERLVERTAELCGKPLSSSCGLDGKDIKTDNWKNKLSDFIRGL